MFSMRINLTSQNCYFENNGNVSDIYYENIS